MPVRVASEADITTTAAVRSAQSVEKTADLAAEARDVDQEGIMALERGQAHKARRHGILLECLRDRRLLMDREQHVALDADHEYRFARDRAQAVSKTAAVFGQIRSEERRVGKECRSWPCPHRY